MTFAFYSNFFFLPNLLYFSIVNRETLNVPHHLINHNSNSLNITIWIKKSLSLQLTCHTRRRLFQHWPFLTPRTQRRSFLTGGGADDCFGAKIMPFTPDTGQKRPLEHGSNTCHRSNFTSKKQLPLTAYILSSSLHMALILRQSSFKICKRGCAEILLRWHS